MTAQSHANILAFFQLAHYAYTVNDDTALLDAYESLTKYERFEVLRALAI